MFQVNCYLRMPQFITMLANNEEAKCRILLGKYLSDNSSKSSCPPQFDGRYCWPATDGLSLAQIRCPFQNEANETVSRWCTENTTLITPFNITVHEWRDADYGGCPILRARSGNLLSLLALALRDDNDESYLNWWHEKLSILDQFGYIVSIVSLVSALSIFAIFSQLQDTRVKVHINLFIAMLLQAIMSLNQHFFYGCKIYYTLLVNATGYDDEQSQICRTLMTFGHYFELTIFTWLLIEGWYFYTFISRAPYNDYISIKPHLLVGWGYPITIMIPWVVIHLYSKQTNFCWVDLDLKINIIAIPILLIVLINVCLFIVNVRIIFIKMKSTYMSHRRMYYWRCIKSSLMLVPMFGTYDILYGIWPWIEDPKVKIGFLLIVRIICSFQGCIVAGLYCFANNHVKKEIKRAWNNWKLKREIDSELSRSHNHSIEKINKIVCSSDSSVNSKNDVKHFHFSTYL